MLVNRHEDGDAMKIKRALLAATISALCTDCKSQSATPLGTFAGTVGVTTNVTTGSNPRSFRSELPVPIVVAVENGKTMVGLTHPFGMACSGEARRVGSTLVVDLLRCQDPYAPGCTVMAMPLVLEIQPGGTLRSRLLVTAFANSPECRAHAGQRDEFEPATFAIGAATR